MIKEDRLHYILNQVRQSGKGIVGELSAAAGVSNITLRRDLKELAEQGLIRRVHGGVVYPAQSPQEAPVIQRMKENRSFKERIAKVASALIQDGESLFIGSGSTTALVARGLKGRSLSVVTNAITVVNELAGQEGVNVVVLGGMLRASELSMLGHITAQALKEVRVSKVIIGIHAIDLRAGLTNDYLPEVLTDRAILDLGSQVVLVADHSKFGKVASAFLAPLERLSTVVTDDQTDAGMLSALRQLGITVVLA
ncbi:MAG: DeoR/GlpR transcriptional regulator [Truepera sp.]|nr:DeoR/GlpR transcriptional regulator [Truepera sp.]